MQERINYAILWRRPASFTGVSFTGCSSAPTSLGGFLGDGNEEKERKELIYGALLESVVIT